jgi:hypothetical protein
MKVTPKAVLMASFTSLTFLGTGFRDSVHAAFLYDVFVEQTIGQGDFGTTPVATITGFEALTGSTLANFYNYSNFSFQNSTVLPFLQVDTTHLFIVEAQGQIGLFMVHDRPNSGTDGLVNMQVNLSNSLTASMLLVDDPKEIPSAVSNSSTQTQQFRLFQGWGGAFTDGYVIGDLANASPSWSASAQFIPIVDPNNGQVFPSTGINQWAVLSADGTLTTLITNPLTNGNLERRVLIRPSLSAPPSNIPEPSALGGLILIGVIGGMVCARSTL